MSAPRTILLATVGGSHQPILTAIAERAPDYVVFICSGKDPGTGRAGSEQQIVGKGLVIKARQEDEKPSLPNIPAQAGLGEERFETLLVPSDDLDTAFVEVDRKLRSLAERFPQPRLVADYTGGTKTMTAALVTAALEHPRVELQVVTGNRANLVRVLDGTQYAAPASVDGIRIGRAIAAHVAAWERFAYDESAQGLLRVAAPRAGELRTRLNRARDLSSAFAAWDRFDHAEAARLLEIYGAVVAPRLPAHLGAVRILTGRESAPREALRIWDLWLNAQRRAAAGRYDDAVARAYRMLEWSAQWILRTRAGLDTADLPAEKAAGLVQPNRDGKYQAGLFAAWELVRRHTGGPAGRFFAEQSAALLDQLRKRNHSILAHGFLPIAKEDWQVLFGWVEEHFIPALRTEMKAAGQREVFPQLPVAYLWDV